MLSDLFIKVFTMSMSATLVIAIIFVIRHFLKSAPKIYSYIMWGVVLVRLLIPFSIESNYSLLPNSNNIVERTKIIANIELVESNEQPVTFSDNSENTEVLTNNSNVNTENVDTEVSTLPVVENINSNNASSVNNVATPQTEAIRESVDIKLIATKVFSVVWLVGLLILLFKSLLDLKRLKRTLGTAELYKENIYFSSKISTAFVLGIFNPKIYLPFGLDSNTLEYIIKHEETHIKRKDPLFRYLSFLALSIHWFNPLVWLSYTKSGEDMEMSCDERVLRELGLDIKKDYSNSLLALATKGSRIKSVQLAFAENDTKSRVKNVLRYRKPKYWVVLVSTIVVLISSFVLLTSSKAKETTEESISIVSEVVGKSLSSTDNIDRITFFLPDVQSDEIWLRYSGYENFLNAINNLEIDTSEDMYNIYSSDYDGSFTINYDDGSSFVCSIMGDYSSISISSNEFFQSYRVINPAEFKATLESCAEVDLVEYKENLYNSKIEFIGSPSAFGNLRELLPLSKYVVESTFEITNVDGKNGVVWNIETEQDYIDTPELYQTVRIAFVLIGNLDIFTINAHNMVYDYTSSYTYENEYFELIYNDREVVNANGRNAFDFIIEDILFRDYYIPMTFEPMVVNGVEVMGKKAYYHQAQRSSTFAQLTTYPKDYKLTVALTEPYSFIVVNNGMVYNIEYWEDFIAKVTNKEGTMLNIVEYTPNNNAIISNIFYNENEFTVVRDSRRDVDGDQVLTKETYKNLLTYKDKEEVVYYYLTNQDSITDTEFKKGVDGLLLYKINSQNSDSLRDVLDTYYFDEVNIKNMDMSSYNENAYSGFEQYTFENTQFQYITSYLESLKIDLSDNSNTSGQNYESVVRITYDDDSTVVFNFMSESQGTFDSIRVIDSNNNSKSYVIINPEESQKIFAQLLNESKYAHQFGYLIR